jgi:hypothetical protein
MGELYSNSDGMHDFFFNMGKYNALQFISMDALFDNPYDLLNTEYYDQFASAEFYAQAMYRWSNRHFDKSMLTITDRCT